VANWNLSVDMRGDGADLARALRDSARHARDLGTASRTARTQVHSLGTASRTTAGQVTRLGGAIGSAQRDLMRMGRQARQSARDLRQVATAADLARARLRALGGDVRIRARLDTDTAGGVASLRAAIAGLDRVGPVRVGVHFDVDEAQLAAASAAAATALAAVQNQAGDTSRALRTLAARARATARALDELADQARQTATGIRTLGTSARAANTHLRGMSTNARTLRGDLDGLNGTVTTLNTNLTGLNGNLGDTDTTATAAAAGTKKMLFSVLTLGSALVPIAATLGPITAGLATAAVAAGVFGLAIGGQISAISKATEAQTAYDDAVREYGETSPEATKAQAELLKQVEKMPPKTREAAAALSVFKDEYRAWSDELSDDTMPTFTKALGAVRGLLPTLNPLVRATSREFGHMMTVFAGATQTSGFSDTMNQFAEFAGETLAKATSGMVRFSQSMSGSDFGSEWREFMDYARQVGPQVGDTLSELGTTIAHLLIALSDMGVSVLEVVEALASMVNAIPTDVLSMLLQFYAVTKLVTLGVAALTAVTGSAAAARLGAYFAVMRAAGVGTTLRATAASMTATAKAAVGLGVLAVAAVGISKLAENARGAPPDVDRLTTSLKELAQTGKFGGELKKTFGDMDGLIDKIKKLQVETERANKSDGFEIPGISHFSDWVGDLGNDLAKGEESLKALEEDFKGLDTVMAEMVSSGYGDQAAADFEMIRSAALEAGIPISEINALLPEYNAALAASRVEQQLAAAGMGLFGQQALDVKGKLDAQKASADGLRGAIQALNDINRQALGGMVGFEASIDAAAKAAKDNAGALDMVNGRLDVNSPKAQAAATALQDLAAKTDEAAASARASGEPWETVSGIYDRGRAQLVKFAQQMGLTESEANTLADSILTIPDEKEIRLEMAAEDAIAGLDSVLERLKATPDAKSVTVSALTQSAMDMLRTLGFTVEQLPDGQFKVTALTGNARSNIAAVQRARDGLSDKTITITTNRVFYENHIVSSTGETRSRRRLRAGSSADGNIYGPAQVRAYAEGGVENHVAQIAQPTFRMWAEPETGGESYIPLAAGKRPRSRAIAEETVRRLGGDPAAIQWNATGSVTGWRYDPGTGSLYSPSEVGQAGQKRKRVGREYVEYFDPAAVERKLRSASKATRAWNRDLERIADRVGGDVAEALAAMGEEGVVMARKMARGSTKYLNEMAAALRGLAVTARASLADYTRAMGKATATDAKFAANLATLAGRGYGDLAGQLAAQGDQAAMELAVAALGDSRRAAAANTAARRANSALTGDQVQQLVAIIAAVRTSKTGLHDVADTTGLGEDDIVAIATKARSQISSSLGPRASKFLADLARAQRGLSYENGGIRPGIYGTRDGAVTFAEPATGGEAYIPLGANKRRQATNVLKDVAGRFGIGLTDVATARHVVVIKDGNTYISVPAVRTGASASDIGFQVGRSYRRAKRGGVDTRG
jgi:DNA-binding transcriptional MerR regulator